MTNTLESSLLVLQILRLVKDTWNNPNMDAVEKTAEMLASWGHCKIAQAWQVIRPGNLLGYEFRGPGGGILAGITLKAPIVSGCRPGYNPGGSSVPQPYYEFGGKMYPPPALSIWMN